MHFSSYFPRADREYHIIGSDLYLCPHCREKMLKENAIFLARYNGWNKMTFELDPDRATGFFLNPDYVRKYWKLSVDELKTYEEVKQMM